MLQSRIIPCLLLTKNGLVKTRQFKDRKYVGDPLNAVKIFNEKEVDEICVLDIDASVENREPNYQLLSKLARECTMPLCYGGGIKDSSQVEKIIELGVEKVAISSGIFSEKELITKSSEKVGAQSIVAVLDIKKSGLLKKKNNIFIYNGTQKIENDILQTIAYLQNQGIGELLINSIDNDGMQRGYDIDFIEEISSHVNVPLTIMGGAGSIEDIKELIQRFGIIGAAAGSLFVFKGKFRAVLLQYLSKEDSIKLGRLV